MRLVVWAALALAASFAAPAVQARGDVVIYRCTDAFGAVTVQNDVPCPKGSRQQRRVVDVPPPMPEYVPRPIAPAPPAPAVPVVAANGPAEPAAEAAVADADRLPPPALFRCNTYDNDSYLSENPAPPPRCVRLQTVGLDGSSDSGAGVACQMVTDQCQRIPDGAACDAWKQRLRETRATWQFARADDADTSKANYERVARIVRDSTCGK